MFTGKWKFLIVSIIAYQMLLTWCMFDLVDTAAYLARTECGDWCTSRLFGFILTNQGGYDTAQTFVWLTLLLVLVNLCVWFGGAWLRRLDARDARREAARKDAGEA